MTDNADRRRRLERLLDIACASQGWSKRRLAKALGRDPTKLVPESGNPKLDFVVALAELLGTPVGDVVAFIVGPAGEMTSHQTRSGFDALDAHAMEAHERGAFQEMADLACRAQAVARTPEQFALACNREYGGWDGLGRYQNALEAIRKGLEHGPLPRWQALMMRSNLANAHYSLWNLTEARTIAGEIIEDLSSREFEHPNDELTLAFAFYVRGNARRRMLHTGVSDGRAIAGVARDDLVRARDEYKRLAEEDDNDSFAAVAHTCEGGLLEVSVEIGSIGAREAVDRVLATLDGAVDIESGVSGEWLESYGWWCVVGANIALAHLDAEAAQQPVAVLTNKAHDIATQLDNWALRERVFTLEHARRRSGPTSQVNEGPWLIDSEDIGVLVGTMGRFPTFRATGWRILESAGFVS